VSPLQCGGTVFFMYLYRLDFFGINVTLNIDNQRFIKHKTAKILRGYPH
jgi:hypothetical protein